MASFFWYKIELGNEQIGHFLSWFDLDFEVMMASQRCNEEDAEAILSNLKMEGRSLTAVTVSTALR